MLKDTAQDNAGDGAGLPVADAHGEAALFLVESLIHGLIARSGLSVAEAVEIVEGAAEVQAEFQAERQSRPAPFRSSATLLDAIHQSLKLDLNTR